MRNFFSIKLRPRVTLFRKMADTSKRFPFLINRKLFFKREFILFFISFIERVVFSFNGILITFEDNFYLYVNLDFFL